MPYLFVFLFLFISGTTVIQFGSPAGFVHGQQIHPLFWTHALCVLLPLLFVRIRICICLTMHFLYFYFAVYSLFVLHMNFICILETLILWLCLFSHNLRDYAVVLVLYFVFSFLCCTFIWYLDLFCSLCFLVCYLCVFVCTFCIVLVHVWYQIAISQFFLLFVFPCNFDAAPQWLHHPTHLNIVATKKEAEW